MLCVAMAGIASNETQYDPRQFDSKMKAMLVFVPLDFFLYFKLLWPYDSIIINLSFSLIQRLIYVIYTMQTWGRWREKVLH